MDNFKEWLTSKLKSLDMDENVFGEYIIGILEDNESEQIESLEGILPDMNDLIEEIVKKWNECNLETNKDAESSKDIDIVKDMAELLEKKLTTSTTVKTTYTEEEKRIRQQILQTYSQTDVPEHEDDESEEEIHKEDNGLEKNTNFLDVQLALKARREEAKAESLRKKEKDKEDREKQRLMREQKKEKRKTVKQERRK